MKLWTVVLGTMAVGLAGIFVPAAINYTTLLFDRQKAYQTYITSFLEKGINQDIELRLRLAGYFANVSDADQKKLWESYETKLFKRRNEVRDTINDLEEKFAILCRGNGGKTFDIVGIDRTRRLLEWAYSEIGYAQTNRSIITPSFDALERRRRELYSETRSVVERLSQVNAAILKSSADYRRFWELYRKDLIGIESREVASRMITLGAQIESLVDNGVGNQDGYKNAVRQLFEQIDRESGDSIAGPPVACSAYDETKGRQQPAR
ncbi:hypothetical protein ACVWYQ_006324 [Bradyrhizobium sp. USDA 3397]